MVVPHNEVGLPAGEWERFFRKAKVEVEKLDSARSARAKATTTGNFLARYVDREVPITINSQTKLATLHVRKSRANQKLYYFEVSQEPTATKESQSQVAADPHGVAGGLEVNLPRRDVVPSTPDANVYGAAIPGNQLHNRDAVSGSGERETTGNGEAW